MLRLLTHLDAFDRRLFARLTRRERHLADTVLKEVSTAANRSLLWFAIAAFLAVFGGSRGRRAALRGLVAITMSSTLVNLPLKYLARRSRPRLHRSERPMLINMPGSFSFPSGHSASAFAFMTGVALEEPKALPLIAPLAGAVAYSRVHLRVHYPLDVAVGAAIGTTMGLASRPVIKAGRSWWNGLAAVPPDLRPQTKQLVLVVSPHSGGGEKLARAKRAISRDGLEIIGEVPVDKISELSRYLKNNGGTSPIVVAAGGDGTVGAVADALVGKQAVMGLLPLGTSNDFARSIDIPMGIERAVRVLARGPVRRVDAGKLSWDGAPPRHFVHAAATGLNVAFARFATRADLRERLGRLTYAAAAALALRDRPVFECEVDDGVHRQQLRLVHLSVINAPVFGGFLDLRVPDASPEDGTLHAIMIEHLPIRRLLRSALYPAVGLHRRIRGFQTITCSRLTVRSAKSMDVTLDGEVCGKIPGTFAVVPSALRVLAPLPEDDHH